LFAEVWRLLLQQVLMLASIPLETGQPGNSEEAFDLMEGKRVPAFAAALEPITITIHTRIVLIMANLC
jgi:hypothetical protein